MAPPDLHEIMDTLNRETAIQLGSLVDQAQYADPEVCALLLAHLTKVRQNMTVAMDLIETLIWQKAGEKKFTVEGLGEVEIKKKTKRTAWDKDLLLRAVLDSVEFNPDTGEITPETPLEKVQKVWNLGAPRVTALRERGLTPDEFCVEEPDGWGVKLPAL